MISMKKALKEYLEGFFAENGFFPDKKGDAASWVFSKPANNDVKQLVTFYKSINQKYAFNVELRTSLKRYDVKHLKPSPNSYTDWWHYSDESSLKEALLEIKEALIQEGFYWLQIKSTPDLIPDDQLGKELLKDPLARAEKFKADYKLDTENTVSLESIEELLLKKKHDRDGVVDWELILNASAFIGEFLLAKLEGSWIWNEDYEAPAIATKDGKVIINVLHRVTRYWSKPELPEYRLDNMLKLLQPHPYL